MRSLYNIKKNSPAPKIKETKDNLCENDEDCYKPIKPKSSFNGNYIEYESENFKNKTFSP